MVRRVRAVAGGEHPMTTIEDRAARLREGRAHMHCSEHPKRQLSEYGDDSWCRAGCVNGHMARRYPCTDDHNPETALDAAALLFDVVTDPDVKAAARVAYKLLEHGPDTATIFGGER